MFVLDPLEPILTSETTSNNLISNHTDVSQDSQNIVELSSGDETSLTKVNSDNVRNVYNQQTHINENPQLYQNSSYDDNDLRRDLSQYRF
ncbi:unnamed protein product, partial [Rotaria sordida]